jgi:hypothetical protein
MEKISINQARKELKPLGYKLKTQTFSSLEGYISVDLILPSGKRLGSILTKEQVEENKEALEIFNRIDKKLN